jgi:hypothetical protein
VSPIESASRVGQRALNGERRRGRAGGRLEHGEDRVARHVDDAALVFFDLGPENSARCIERHHGRSIIAGHEARVAGDVRGQNGGQSMRERIVAQRIRMQTIVPTEGSTSVPNPSS